MTGSITTAVAGPQFQVGPGKQLNYAFSMTALKTYSGKAIIERSTDAGQSWATQFTVDGTGVAKDDSFTASGSIVNESTTRHLFRVRGTVATADDPLLFSFLQKQSVTAAVARTHDNLLVWLNSLPTSDPAIAGEPWLNSGVLTVSAG